ncbi:hypothetical protein [Mucilaginibacter sp.]
MKTTRSKKLDTRINTICDFNTVTFPAQLRDSDTTLGTDPTNTTVTIVTTLNKQTLPKASKVSNNH